MLNTTVAFKIFLRFFCVCDHRSTETETETSTFAKNQNKRLDIYIESTNKKNISSSSGQNFCEILIDTTDEQKDNVELSTAYYTGNGDKITVVILNYK